MTEKEKAVLVEKLKEVRKQIELALEPCDGCASTFQGDPLPELDDLIYDLDRDLLVCEVKA